MTMILNPQFFDANAEPLSGGKVYSYTAGTSTAKATYPSVDDARNNENANTNPVILDAKGRANIVLDGATKLVLKDANDNTIWTVDDLDAAGTDFNDSNGNEILAFNAAANAVNYLELKNATTGNAPQFTAAGSDTNIDFHIKPKGTGDTVISVGGLSLESGDLNVVAGDATFTSGDVTITSGNLTVDNLAGLNVEDFPLVTSGMVYWFAGSSVPSGYLECNGAAVSRTTYADLFAAIGTTYGVGDGSTTFNLPDQARNTLVGKDGTGTSTLGNSVGDTGGAETHTLTEAEMASHTHNCNIPGNLTNEHEPGGITDTFAYGLSPPHATPMTTTSAGSGNAHNIVQPSLVMMMVIKT